MKVSLPKSMTAQITGAVGVNPAALGVPCPAAGTEFTATVPIPPSTNNLFITAGRRRMKSPAYRAWLAVAVPILARLRRPTEFPVRVVVTVFNCNTARDTDNLAKPVSDGLVEAGVIPGDSIRAGVWETLQRYRPDGPKGVALVTIERVHA